MYEITLLLFATRLSCICNAIYFPISFYYMDHEIKCRDFGMNHGRVMRIREMKLYNRLCFDTTT